MFCASKPRNSKLCALRIARRTRRWENSFKNAARAKGRRHRGLLASGLVGFQGFGSADAALQSSLWAANNGDLKNVAGEQHR